MEQDNRDTYEQSYQGVKIKRGYPYKSADFPKSTRSADFPWLESFSDFGLFASPFQDFIKT